MDLLTQIHNIDFEDLYLIEKDLCFQEKASLAFLLFADNKPNAQFILQKLLVISQTPDEPSDILTSYTKINKDWQLFLVEALAIIKANRVLRKLGMRLSEVRTHFLPHNPQISLNINQILKALYVMCDELTPTEAGELVLKVQENNGTSKDHLRFYNFDYLEVFLLEWIEKQKLDASGSETTDISILIKYFESKKMKYIKTLLEDSLKDLATNDSERKELLSPKQEVNHIRRDLERVEISELNCYKIRRETAGFVLIINQRDFHRSTDLELQHLLSKEPLKERQGTDVDKKSLEEKFSSFGYRPIIKENLNNVDVLSNIREVVKRSIMYDSLIVCILTHGIEGSIYAADSVSIKISEIEKIIAQEDSLRDKPKMLIIQACQGNVLQNAKDINNLETDSPEGLTANYRDMVKAMSTVPGHASLRYTITGSWFIQTLCEKIDQFGDRYDILEILTEVNNAIGERRGSRNECMTSTSSQTLRKKFRLPSRLPNQSR